MIESYYWKEELTRIAKTIRTVQTPPRWSERTHAVIERDLMVGFFIVRRLIELCKVSSETSRHAMTVFSCPRRGRRVHRVNHHRVWELYDLKKERKESKTPYYLSNQFIHAYTSFVARDNTRNWSDVYIVSDYDRNNCLWRIPIVQIRELFHIVAHDYPHKLQMLYSNSKGDYEVSTN